MTSIRSNLSALTALQALKTIQTSLRKTQEQISTGLRVKEAADNASYWSIGVRMRSDVGALGAVKDSIRQSVAMLDTFTSALDKVLLHGNGPESSTRSDDADARGAGSGHHSRRVLCSANKSSTLRQGIRAVALLDLPARVEVAHQDSGSAYGEP
jgi:hypothetical protein